MRAFRVAIYASGIQPFDLLHSVEAPRPIRKVSQPLDFASASQIVFHMRVLHGQAVGMVADNLKMVEFYSQPQVAFTVLPVKCPYLEANYAEQSIANGPVKPTKEALTDLAPSFEECVQMLEAQAANNPNVHKMSPEQIAWAKQLKEKVLGNLPPNECGGDCTITISEPAPLTPPPPVPAKPVASRDKLAWWQRLLLAWFSLWLRAASRSAKEDSCGK
jgi:hypothetical protein